ncbi:substrate-binding domain-containing protein [Kineococcus sp. T13]|uniref:LacI family DNA-binding transcriptional regulator n=1 Tax=Kineococcus vitellinus TaxID=2696565 RepID=UPI001411C7AA|nr:LacI family DNA-binding transcriptional regulator [Kineococcus vitellinus]NAZ75994.1 substrate-binding domain-containing protein [Kineococcus vitellinus]
MATVKEVAQRAGVSLGTVSNVLNRPEVVSEALRTRVQQAIAELGFVRNESARQLRAGVSRTIAVVVLDVANPFFTDVIAGAEDLAERHDALVVMCNSANSAEREARHLRRLDQQRVLGVLLTPVHDAPSAALTEVREHGTPVVLVDRGSGSSGHSSVAVDDVLGGRLVGEHLVGAGHRRIAYTGLPTALRQVEERLRGLREAVGAAGGVQVVQASAMSVRAGSQVAAQLLAGPAAERPSAVFCANDLLALGVLNECQRRGVRVPQDLAIVGYDDIGFAATASVPLTSVRQPRELLGRTAVELLLAQVEGRPAQQLVFEPELVVRRSTARRGARQALRGAPGAAPEEAPEEAPQTA